MRLKRLENNFYTVPLQRAGVSRVQAVATGEAVGHVQFYLHAIVSVVHRDRNERHKRETKLFSVTVSRAR